MRALFWSKVDFNNNSREPLRFDRFEDDEIARTNQTKMNRLIRAPLPDQKWVRENALTTEIKKQMLTLQTNNRLLEEENNTLRQKIRNLELDMKFKVIILGTVCFIYHS